ncbi:uncharacterized protein LOC135473110 [Liolophura sinensis]|uniref:uncharacterized protein LOC135473110 n=1 Tax=Liolophura sinensis TaxID=3198878 RepID=UPI0031596C49
MATGHAMPGYGDPTRRSKSAFPYSSRTGSPVRVTPPSVSHEELSRIKEEARLMWTPTERAETTYGLHFTQKSVAVKAVCRPTSPTRRNNPHPSPAFLTNRLHYVPGYHNPDTTMGKAVYRIDASLPPQMQLERREPREKYKARPATTSINQYRQKHNFRDFMEPVEAQALDAWVALADDKDKEKVLTMFSDDVPASQRNLDAVEERYRATTPSARHPLASLHRYLKPAGVEEASHISRIMDTIRSNPARHWRHPGSVQAPEMTVLQMRADDIEAISGVKTKRKPAKGDFLIHPEWPPYMYHHRIPGF